MIYATLDLVSELICSMCSCCRKIIATNNWPKNLVLLIMLLIIVVTVTFYDSYDLLLGTSSHVGRSKSFVGGQRSNFNLIAVIGIHSWAQLY